MRRQPMSTAVDALVDSYATVDKQKRIDIGGRIKAAREALGLTQEGLAKAVGGSKRGIQENEARNRVPGGDVVSGMIGLGINANWLLTGEGPMLMSELSTMARVDMLLAERNELAVSLQKALEKAWAGAPAPQAPRINVDALEAIIEGLLRAAPNVPAAKLASVAANLYQDLIDKEMITPEGLGAGNQSDAA